LIQCWLEEKPGFAFIPPGTDENHVFFLLRHLSPQGEILVPHHILLVLLLPSFLERKPQLANGMLKLVSVVGLLPPTSSLYSSYNKKDVGAGFSRVLHDRVSLPYKKNLASIVLKDVLYHAALAASGDGDTGTLHRSKKTILVHRMEV
jgi:hypothetical protein